MKTLAAFTLLLLPLLSPLTDCRIVRVSDNGRVTDAARVATKKLKIVTIQQSPSFKNLTNAILLELSQYLGLDYELIHETAYGFKNREGQWNGMIGQLVNGTADLAIADLTITAHRSEVVDFSHPFLMQSLGILMNRKDIGNMKTIKDLIANPNLKLGVVNHGSTHALLMDSNAVLLRQLYEKIDRDDSLVRSTAAGVDRALDGGFGLITSTAYIQEIVARHCNLTLYQELLPAQASGLGIAMQADSIYRRLINRGILMMQESGKMQQLMEAAFRSQCHVSN